MHIMKLNILKKEKFNWFRMFWDGFTKMSRLGKTLWILVAVKLVVMFLILKLFFFPNALKQYDTPDDKAQHVRKELIERYASPR